MQLLFLKNGFLALTFSAIASVGGLITGCTSTASQNQSQGPEATATTANDKQMMNHSMGMDLGPADTNFDLRFIDAMIPHHQGAVEMAKEAQVKSKRPEIKKLADNIIKSQNQEITQMKQWRQGWYPKAGDKPMAYNSQMGHMMEMSSDQMKGMMMSQDLGAADSEFDLRFINAMIPHHEGAVKMGQDALSKSKRPEIKKLAQEIVKAQEVEIKEMQQWRKAWYNK
ncbi:DUF305 domain-containing protein [Nostoc sp. 'Peltigera membranacea cyanobiont' 232]|uniref:DUF305 domain-containing protein n=1 Tax=Nostoc sp. 'Peltigera membranacea cyanobiont' 232 TaxID=2014531 RepID=UPI000B95193E|nr:DUF305 domain-containing protein [Nostoc sp. 'Peltigera membranacea cyanobiont' 232]OYE06298.1 DUF305 domain-containing protein [Nostoc sp. 'Peltigera membranacea cyanobiont' 232]